jgi:hypothetical protein|tara:strand:+ start:237 stop:665 length:429 start_codon:yes stop_codon:yes gene_type:complete
MTIHTVKSIASELDGVEYPLYSNHPIFEKAKEAGVVVVFGSSDDMVIVAGAVKDDDYVYQTGKRLLGTEGFIFGAGDIDTDEGLENYLTHKKAAKSILVKWASEDELSWTYETEVPHETFYIMEDGERYCRGIVFHVDKLKN